MSVESELAALIADLPAEGKGDLKANLMALVTALTNGSITEPEFEAQFRAELAAAYMSAYLGELPPDAPVTDNDVAAIKHLLDAQAPNIAGFGHDIVTGASTMPDETRVGMYDQSQHAVAQAGVIAAFLLLMVDQPVNWVMDEGNEHCDPCQEAADGSPYLTASALPGIPGTDYCDGWTNCGCVIEPA